VGGREGGIAGAGMEEGKGKGCLMSVDGVRAFGVWRGETLTPPCAFEIHIHTYHRFNFKEGGKG
jgi:hypothetical protein